MRSLIKTVLAYAQGEGEFDFSGLPDYERANEGHDAWMRIELDLEDALAEQPDHAALNAALEQARSEGFAAGEAQERERSSGICYMRAAKYETRAQQEPKFSDSYHFDRTLAFVLKEAAQAICKTEGRESVCRWCYDEHCDCWETDCGESFWLTDGTPKDNQMQYCPYCGGRLRAIHVAEE